MITAFTLPAALFRVGQAGGLADLGKLPRVIVPVVAEQGAHVCRDRHLFGVHDALEERDARLALEVRVTQRLQIAEHLLPLRVERAPLSWPSVIFLRSGVTSH